MKYKIIKHNVYIHLKLNGTISSNDIKYLKIIINSLLAEKKYIFFDLRGLKHIHFKTAELLIKCKNSLKNNNLNIKIICINPYIISILNIVDYNIFYDITPNLISAKNSIEQKIYIQ